MAVTVTDNRTTKDQADATTGWAAAGGTTSIAVGTVDPSPIEATGHIASTASNATTFVWHNGTSLGTGPHLLYVWLLTTGVLDTRANGGLMILVGDGTNRVGYHIGGADVSPFRSDAGEAGTRVGYMCAVIDTSTLATWPYGATVQAGARATLEGNLGAITDVGAGFKTLAKAVGGAVNIWVDIVRHGLAADITVSGLTISGGTSGDPGKFRQIAVVDRDSADLKAHGVIRELGEGVFGMQGTLRFGDQGTGSSWFEDKDAVVVFEKRDLDTTRYQIRITDNATGTTTFKLGTKVGSGVTATGANGCSLIAATGVGWQFDAATDTDVTDVFIYGSTFKGATGGVKLRSGHEFIGGLIDVSGQVTANGATMVNTSVLASTVAANNSALLWNVNTDPDGFLDGMTFSMGTNAHHAIRLGISSPTTVTLRGLTFTGFNASNEQNNSVLYLADQGSDKSWIINAVGCSGTVSYKKDRAGDTVSVVVDPVTVLVNVKNSSGTNIQSARVFVKASDNTGPFPFEEAVTIVNAGTTATVTHTDGTHAMATNDQVVISGASEEANNGIFTITVTGTDTYEYTMGSSPSSPTGTIISTFVAISGETDIDGNISLSRVFPANQNIVGWVRKATAAPFYKTGPITGTVSSASGLPVNIQLILDE